MPDIPLCQPLEQTPLRLVVNLLLAPIGGLLVVYFPLFVFILFLSAKLDSVLSVAQMMLLFFLAACIFYFIFLFIPLLICCLALRYFRLFNIFSICLLAVISHFPFAYFTGLEKLSNSLISLSFFSVPTVGFFLFLCMRSHRICVENS